jgi:20S proteasome subunit beta 1
MAINFKDGVILGADSRTTTGAYIANRVTDKLTQVHDTIWCCRSGSAADTQAVADIVSYHLGMYGIVNDESPTTQTAAALFQELCYDNKDMLRYVYLFFYFTWNTNRRGCGGRLLGQREKQLSKC